MKASHLPRCDNGDIRGALRATPRADILKVRLKISFREARLRKAHRLISLPRVSKKERTNTNHTHTLGHLPLLTFAWARALISAEAFITSISYALFTLRNFPTSGASGLRLCAGTTSKYDAISGPVPRSSSSLDARCLRER